MDLSQTQRIEVEATNIGGIDTASVAFSPGVTVLSGRNATNRTSLLQAIMAALGSDQVSVKGDAEEASVTLSMGDETATRTLINRDGRFQTSGDPYLDEPLLADLFAFLIESNDVRRAVSTDCDIRELIMRPVDTAQIETEIDRLIDQRKTVTTDLENLIGAKKELPALEEQRTQLAGEIESTRETLQETENKIEALDADLEQTKTEKGDIENKLSELQAVRNELEKTGYDLETEKETLSSLRTELSELETECSELPQAPAESIDELTAEISRLRQKKRQHKSASSDLQSVIRLNKELLEGSTSNFLERDNSDENPVTDQLVEADTVTCWTCNSTVEATQIEQTVSTLQELSKSKLQQATELESQISDLQQRQSTLEATQRQREEITRRQTQLEREIEETEENINALSTERDTLRSQVSTLEAELENKKDEAYEQILSVHREANQLEYDLGSLESELEDVEAEIASLEATLAEETKLKKRREQIRDEIKELRIAVERTEREIIAEFNDHMETVLELLEYRNLERIWLERSEQTVREGRQTVTESQFTLHVVRKTQHGTTYQDTVAHLSESERKVTGLILALAGYLAHEVYEAVPFVLLDSLEAIDAERIATLVDYLDDLSPSLVVALLEEDAEMLDDSYHYINMV